MSSMNEEKVTAQDNPAITIDSVGTLVGVVGSHNNVRDIVGGNMNVAPIALKAPGSNGSDTLMSDGGFCG